MKDTWRQLFRRLATGCVVCGSLAWASAVSYAVQLAYDSASDPVYASGWQAGQSGGFGFTPWNFDAGYWWEGTVTAYSQPGFHEIDDGLKAGTHFSNPFNNIGRSWATGAPATSDGAPRYGRGFPALQVGQTFSVLVDNPTRRQFFKGYTIHLIGGTGGVNGNICNKGHECSPNGTPVSKLDVWRFEYGDNGQWKITDSVETAIPLFDNQTGAGGMRLDVTLTGAETYDLVMTPLANPALAYTQSGTLDHPGAAVDWFAITFYNTFTDTNTPPTSATDFYIRSMEINGPAPPGVPGDYNGNGVVDGADYVLWRNGGPLQNEVDTTGTVNAADYSAWRARFGNTAGSGSVLASTVPEPGGFVSFAAAIGSLAVVANGRRLSRSGA